MKWETLESRTESTPFLNLELGEHHYIRLWWSKNAGQYGYQVYGALCFVGGEYSKRDTVFYKTDGCGYCKESAAIEALLRSAGVKPHCMTLGAESIPYKYRIGGNHYAVPEADIVELPDLITLED